MKFSYQWISSLVDGLGNVVEPRELMRLITMKTAECEGLEEAGALLANATPAEVLVVEPIEGSHNRKAVVRTIAYGEKTVVCGAANCRVGLWTMYAPIGIKKISGVESDGMLASGRELGINRDHEGILELSKPELGLQPDWVIEVDNKSLTHRPDLWGHYGMAREVSAITGKPLRDPVDMALLPAASAEPVKRVAIGDFTLCPRYSGLVFENVTVQPSPLWLQYRLEAAGLNPINNIVDVTNYVLAELAQPMHAFDADKLRGDTIFVRNAGNGEKIVALNKEEYELDDTNLVIADAGGAIAIAGVIGGDESAIGDGTTRIVLESACFNATSVRKTAAKIKNRTDASMRFEKSQDPENTVRGLARAVALLQEVSPGIRLVGGLIDSYQPLPKVAPIVLSTEWVQRKLGHPVAAAEIKRILEALQFGVSNGEQPGEFIVEVPSWRATKDISLREDLVEEIGRMIGYGEMTPTAPLVPSVVPPANPTREFHHHLRDLVAAQGYTEAYNYSFLSDETIAEFGLAAQQPIRVLNPIASDQAYLRTSLVPRIVNNIRENRKHFETFRLFEIGHEIHRNTEGLPTETPHLAAAFFAKDGDGSAGLFELKRLASCIVPGIEVRPCDALPYEHPARAAELFADGTRVGRLFELHPSMVEAGRAAILDLDLAAAETLSHGRKIQYKPLRRFPTSAFDLSVVTGERTLVGEIEAGLRAYATANVTAIEFQRQYSGPPLAAGQKSVSYRITVGAADRTLSSAEVSAVRDAIIEGMRSRGYELRV
ncbi:phenylalanine--tRNA ligase subunit beta [Bryobacterales bacterium F-183]|nr:phenylalanine--tRNA ligase subunit beta [Bryobacterales bacterium F-183]